MSKADEQNTRTTLADSTAAVAPTSLPSIADLGRRIAALYAVHNKCDEESIRAKSHSVEMAADEGMDITYAQIVSLQEMVCTLPAVTLADAAVQVATAFTVASAIRGHQNDEGKLSIIGTKLDRLLLSALPVIAKAAGVDLVEMDWEQLAQLRAHRFAALEDVR